MNFTDVEITFEYAAAWMGTGRFLEDYEIIATWFYRETGSLRPGKDCQNESYEDRLLKWQTWQPRAVQRMAIWLAEQQDKLNKSTQDLKELRARVKELENTLKRIKEAKDEQRKTTSNSPLDGNFEANL